MKILDFPLKFLVICEVQSNIDVSGYRCALILISYLKNKLMEVSKGISFQKYMSEFINSRECWFFYGILS